MHRSHLSLHQCTGISMNVTELSRTPLLFLSARPLRHGRNGSATVPSSAQDRQISKSLHMKKIDRLIQLRSSSLWILPWRSMGPTLWSTCVSFLVRHFSYSRGRPETDVVWLNVVDQRTRKGLGCDRHFYWARDTFCEYDFITDRIYDMTRLIIICNNVRYTAMLLPSLLSHLK